MSGAAPAAKRVLVITTNPSAAPFRVRMAALMPGLRERGFALQAQVRSKTWSDRRALLASAGDYHAVILHRKLLDPWDASLLRRCARRIYFDVDDAVMYGAEGIGLLSRARTWWRFAATARVLDYVLAGNTYLADAFRARGCAVTVLPTVVDPRRYTVKTHGPTRSPTLVWIGSKSTLPYLRQAMAALESAAKRAPGLRLLTIANDSVSSAILPVDHVPWSQATEAEALLRGDIGIAPTPSDRWTLGKCGFKIIQYMAAGLPVIASPIGANAEIVRAGETGLLPAMYEEWPDLVRRLASDVDERLRMGSAGRRRVEAEFSIARAVEAWATLLES